MPAAAAALPPAASTDPGTRSVQPRTDGSKPLQYGLIAEEVAEVLPALAVFNTNGQPETVKYRLLPSLLLSAYRREHATIEA